MRLASYALRGRPSFGAVVGDGIVDLRARLPRFATLSDVFRAQALNEARAAGAGVRPDLRLAEIELLPPLPAPEKILCIGINYANRGQDYNVTNNPKYPSMFYRAPSSLVGSGQHLVRPKISEQLDYEGEIAIVIGREGKHVAKDRALGMIAGVTLANEGTIRDWTRHGQFNVTQGKNFDASGAIGPWIETDFDLNKPLQLTVRKNGEVTQDDTTASMIFSFADIIAYTTSFMTLKAGDIICTGTPVKKTPKVEPPVWLKPGDTIEVECPQIGVLRNTVVDEA
ncbi:MAG TPA: fumarylacetoacetate hydrolase family protein [Xanthobacteraceae bacterium]|nr:fumarylacetoacetate hydrolase family protein [Xanthobacteraceae bacterium]